MNIIAFAGQARSGKTTMAHAFARTALEQGMTPVILSFAGPIKEVAAHEGLTKDSTPEQYRLFCQDIGKQMRAEDPDYWVKKFSEQLEVYAKKDAVNLERSLQSDDSYSEILIIIDDLRYENEFNLIRRLQGSIVLVVRDRLPESHADWRSHESEEFANYWTTAPLEDVEDMFDTAILNDTEDPTQERLDDMAHMLVQQLTSDIPEDFSSGTSSRDDVPEDLRELLELMRRLRRLFEEDDNE